MVTRDQAGSRRIQPVDFEELKKNDLLLIEDYIRELAPINKPRNLDDVCVVYGRFSSRSQKDESIDIQNEKAVAYARKHGLTLRPGQHLFADYAVSGDDLIGRHQLDALRRLARAGGFNKLLIKGVDRLSRRQWQSYMLLEEFASLGIEVHITGPQSYGLLDSTSAFIDGFFAMRERQKILSDTKNGLESAAWRGDNVGKIPYGFRKGRTGEMFVDEQQAAVVIRIFDYFAKSVTPQKIARILNSEGIPSPHGKQWAASQIFGNWASGNGMVRNVKYIGIAAYNITQQIKDPITGKRKKTVRPRSEWIMVRKPEWRIVSDDLWRKVMRRLKQIARPRKAEGAVTGAGEPSPLQSAPERRSEKSTLLFHDRYFCRCGSRMYSSFTTSKVRTLYCASAYEHGQCTRRTFTSSGYVEVEILRALRDDLLSDEAVELYRKTYAESLVAARENALRDRDNLAKEIEVLNRRIDRTWTDIVDADQSDPDMKRNYDTYRDQRDKLVAKLRSLRVPGKLPDFGPTAIAGFKQQIEDLILQVPFVERTTEDIELVAALRGIVRRVEIDRPCRSEGYQLVVETSLSGLPGSSSVAEPEARAIETETDEDNAPIHMIRRVITQARNGGV